MRRPAWLPDFRCATCGWFFPFHARDCDPFFGGGKKLAAVIFCWVVSASAVRTIDGDTFTAVALVWPGQQNTLTVRVLGVNTPEMKGETRAAAERAREFTKDWVGKGELQLAIGCGTPALDSFGRYLAIVTRDRAGLADDLIAAGLGVKFR